MHESAPSIRRVRKRRQASSQCSPAPIPSPLKIATYPQLARDVVRYVGDCVAVVVAENRYQAQDAVELIDVDYEPLPAVVDAQKAAGKGAPQLHADIPGP
jgi:carbon-monoxide dehydrogenase large subunit